MKNEQAVKAAFEYAAERYAAIGVDVNEVLKKMQGISLSLHCWQTDDVSGFENPDGELTGGIQATGNYPGKARNIDEVRADLLKVKSLLPGSHRINLHEVYGDFGGKRVDRDEVTPDHFTSWMQWAKENGLKLDFNSTSFSHPKSGMLTLANPDDSIREFWVEHTRRCRWIADKISSLLLFTPEIMLHVSRPIRWDSDHVTIMNDDTLDLAHEVVRCDALSRVHIGLDYFDASINRIGAYVIGSRATQKCFLQALLEPLALLRKYEAEGRFFERLALLEECKSLPWNAVWDYFCLTNDVPVGEDYIADIEAYEKNVTSKRQ